MKRSLIVIIFLGLSIYCFAQQNMPRRIIGQIPNNSSTKLYQIQVGAFKIMQNAENAYYKLIIEGFNPAYETYLDYTRVMITGIPAVQIPGYLIKVKQAGFDEVIIREDNTRDSISEKWEITTPGSTYSSFEFNQDHNYIVVKNAASGESDKLIYFGEYTMPAKDIIELINLGILKINTDNSDAVSLSFSPADEPGTEIDLAALKTERIPESPEIDLFCRTWRIVNSTNTDDIGKLIIFSNAGTYFVTTPDGKSNDLSQWRWNDDNNKDFEYSHDNWQHYGRAKINELSMNFLKFFDPGFYLFVSGYSSATLNYDYELMPVN